MNPNNIHINHPDASSEEINKHMNFDDLIRTFETKSKSSKKFPKKGKWFFGSLVSLTIITICVLFFLSENNKNTKNKSVIKTFSSKLSENRFDNFVKWETFKINPQISQVIETSDGSIIKIEENTFTDSVGNLIRNTVEIKYRSFRKPLDYISAGINMDYDSLNNSLALVSQGMFELMGFSDNKKVSIKSDRPLVVNFKRNNGDVGNQYYYNDGKWDFVKRDDFVYQPQKITANQYNFKDSTSISKAIKKYDEKIESLTKIQPIKPVKVDTRKYRFRLDVLASEFPALAGFKDKLFQIVASDKTYNSDIFSEAWIDVQVKPHKKNGLYNMILSKKDSRQLFVIQPVLSDVDYEVAIQEYKKLYDKGLEAMSSAIAEKRDLQKKYDDLKKQYSNKVADYKGDGVLSNRKLNEYVSKFRVYKWGLHNCDIPISYPKDFAFVLVFKDSKGNMLKNRPIYLVEKGKNVRFQFLILGNGLCKVYFDRNKKYYALIPDTDSTITCLQEHVLDNLNVETNNSFVLSPGTSNIKELERRYKL